MKRWGPVIVLAVCFGLFALVQWYLVTHAQNLDRVVDHSSSRTNPWGTKAVRELLGQRGVTTRTWGAPWTRLADYVDVLDWVEREGLVDQIDPVQFSIRLLVPPGSLLTSLPDMRPHIRGIEPENFAYVWVHPDPRMDALHRDVSLLVHAAALANEDPARTFRRIRTAATRASGGAAELPESTSLPSALRARPPRLTEPWFC